MILVQADMAAKYLGLSKRRVLELARRSEIPAHWVSGSKRKRWRFNITELEIWSETRWRAGVRVMMKDGRTGILLTAPGRDKLGELWVLLQWDDAAIPTGVRLAELQE